MSGRSIEGFGRTGWDFLYSRSHIVLAALLIFGFILLSWIRPDLADAVVEAVLDNVELLLPLASGFVFGRFLYFRILRQYVILQVEDPEHNRQAEFEISLQRFQTMTVEDGIMNPVATASGIPLYRVLDFDPVRGTIRAGHCHDPKTDIASVMVQREHWESLVKHDHDKTLRVEELDQLRYQESVDQAHVMAASLLDALHMPPVDPKRPPEDDDPEDGR